LLHRKRAGRSSISMRCGAGGWAVRCSSYDAAVFSTRGSGSLSLLGDDEGDAGISTVEEGVAIAADDPALGGRPVMARDLNLIHGFESGRAWWRTVCIWAGAGFVPAAGGGRFGLRWCRGPTARFDLPSGRGWFAVLVALRWACLYVAVWWGAGTTGELWVHVDVALELAI